jgi:hypothetical protein
LTPAKAQVCVPISLLLDFLRTVLAVKGGFAAPDGAPLTALRLLVLQK